MPSGSPTASATGAAPQLRAERACPSLCSHYALETVGTIGTLCVELLADVNTLLDACATCTSVICCRKRRELLLGMLAGAYSRGGTRKFQRCLFCSIARRGPCGGSGTEFGCRRSLAMINTTAIAAAQGRPAADLALANSGALTRPRPCLVLSRCCRVYRRRPERNSVNGRFLRF